MSFRGQLLKAGIDSDGKIVTVYKQDGRLDIATASTETSGTVRSCKIDHTQNAGSATILEALRVSIDSEYRTGSWANAIVGRIDYGDAGDAAGGMAAAICAEMNMPAKDMHNLGGGYYCVDCELNVPDGCELMHTVSTRPVAWFNLAVWGDNAGEFDDLGFLFRTDGLSAGSGHLLSENSRTLRVNIGGTTKYLYIGDTEDTLDVERLVVGTDSADEALGTTATNRIIDIYSSSASTSSGTSVRPIYLRHTVLGVGGVGHRAEFHTRCAVQVGTWINALKGYMEFDYTGTGGRTTGLASAVCAEMKMPNAAVPTGQYFPLEIELVGQTSTGTGAMSGFITVRASGTLTNWNANAYFLQVEGLTADSTALLSTNSLTLKSRLGTQGSGVDRYLVFSQMTDGLGFGTSTTDMALGTSTSKRPIEIYTSSASVTAGTSIKPIYMRHTILGAGGVGHRAEFHSRCEVQTGTWVNALKGYMEFDYSGTGGETTGLASAICAELKMPNAAVSHGHYYPLEIEFVGQANSGPGVHHGFITCRASGTLTSFNDSGFLLDIEGVSADTDHMFSTTPSDKTDGKVNATLRIQVLNTTYWIPLWDAKDGS